MVHFSCSSLHLFGFQLAVGGCRGNIAKEKVKKNAKNKNKYTNIERKKIGRMIEMNEKKRKAKGEETILPNSFRHPQIGPRV